jgi:hypothetical protein
MSQLLQENEFSGKEVLGRFWVAHEDRSESLSYKVNPDAVDENITNTGREYLIHWTRAVNGAWPTERAIDYYRALLASDSYPRDALNTLCNILRAGVVKASGRHMPGSEPTVSFTGLSPCDALPLMRWRARYREMSFEPYGIGVRRGRAHELGVRPVEYYQGKRPSEKHESHLWLTQSLGEKGDWGREEEYRHLGDFPIANLDRDDLICFCRTGEEATALEREFGIRAVAFLSD